MDSSSTRVAVVGGGPSGLSAAVALVKLGYKHVTVLEQHETVGGMCASALIDGRVYDLGGQVLASQSSPTVMSIVRELDLQVEMEDMSQHRLAKLDLNTGRYEDFNMATDYVELMAVTSELQAKAVATNKLGIHALSTLAYEPTPAFLRKRGFEIPGALASAYTGSGYGYVEDIPYAYVHEFLRSSMLGKLCRVKDGYGSLWNKVANTLPDVRCNVKVRSIDRKSKDVVRISVVHGSAPFQESVLEFDKVIISGSLPIPKSNRTYRSAPSTHDEYLEPTPKAAGVLDYSDEELQLLSKVQTIEYYTTAVTISGLDLPAGFYFPESALVSSTMGHIVALQRFFADTDVYLIWSYGNAQCDQQQMTDMLHDDIRRMGGRVESLILQRKWVYSPHVNSKGRALANPADTWFYFISPSNMPESRALKVSADMADGFYDKLDNLQGKNNCYYVGGLLAFELTERNAAFALNVVRRYFGPAGDPSDRTFTTQASQHQLRIQKVMPPQADLNDQEAAAKYAIKEMAEIPGVTFPKLASIDAYVSFYGGHKVHRDRIVYRWVNDGGRETDTLTFGQVDSHASIIAQRLVTGKSALKQGDRAIMVYQPSLEFIEAFLGCLRARVLPVPVIPPDPTKPYDQALAKVASIAEAANAKVILSTSSYHNVVLAISLRDAVFGQKAPRTKGSGSVQHRPHWPNLPWHHTDAWTRGPFKDGVLAWTARKVTSSAKTEKVVKSDSPSAYDSFESNSKKCKDLDSHDSSIKKGSSISGSRNNAGDFLAARVKEIFAAEPKPEELCFLQFTSGSTGDPKGVMITHGGLLHNILCMKRAYHSTSRTVCISWLPPYHDMGLIGGILTSLVTGGCLVMFSPATFIRKPLMWLELIARYKATHSAAPNFAYELVTKRYENLLSKSAASPGKELNIYDLSSIHMLMSAAEPIRPASMRRFLQLFHSSGLRESKLCMAYGLAENCVFVSCSYGLSMDWDGRICVGFSSHGDPDVDVRVVNADTCEEQPEGVEGEIWVCSPSNGVGYWGLKDLSEKTFGHRLRDSPDGRQFLRTGDLGRVINGHIFVTGRMKDVIIIQGRNIYPSDIERTVENCSDDVRPGCSAAFIAPPKALKARGIVQCLNFAEQEDQLSDSCIIVVAEVRDENLNIDAAIELVSTVKSAVATEHGINLAYVELVKPRSIPKTTSGKIRRRESLKRFSEGTLLSIQIPDNHSGFRSRRDHLRRLKNDILSRKNCTRSYHPSSYLPESRDAAPLGKAEIEMFLIDTLAERTGLQKAEISLDENFSNYADSVTMTGVASKLSEFLHVQIPPMQLYTSSSITEIADWSYNLVNNSIKIGENGLASDMSSSGYERQENIGNKKALLEFLVGVLAKKTRLSATKISVKDGLTAYNLTSLDSVSMAQEVSEYLGVHIPPLQLYTANCIEELADNCLALLHGTRVKSAPSKNLTSQCANQSNYSSTPPNFQEISENLESELISDKELASAIEPSKSRLFLISGLQILGLWFIAALLLIPAAMIYVDLLKFITSYQWLILKTFLAISLIPAAWMLYIGFVGLTIHAIGCKVLQPNYAVQSAIPLWSARYVQWWTLYRLQDFASKSLAVHLRGTVLLVWWYRLMGAQIGNNVHIDTTDITDPSLLYIGNGAIVKEEATLQSHDVRAGVVRFEPIKIGSRCIVGSFAVVQRGTTMEAASRIETLCKTRTGQILRPKRQSKSQVQDSIKAAPWILVLQQIWEVYLQGLVSTVSALVAYAAFRSFGPSLVNSAADPSKIQALEAETFLLFPLALTFPWALMIVAPITLFSRHDPALIFYVMMRLNNQLPTLLVSLGTSFVVYGIILGALTSALKWIFISDPRGRSSNSNLPINRNTVTTQLIHGLLRSAHHKFFILLTGTEALCIYLRSLGAKIGRSVSIRRVNALVDPDFLNLSNECHLGDFSKIVTTRLTLDSNSLRMSSDVVHVGDGCVVGAQSVVLPGVTMADDSILGAMSVASDAMFLQGGGVYVGGREGTATVMISKQTTSVDLRIEEMDKTYKQIVAKLATDIARSTIKSTVDGRRARYFHRAGVAGRGTLRVLNQVPDLPQGHEIFSPGRSYPVVVRHSNALSGADDRCPDAKGASLRILHPNNPDDVHLPLLDLVMKTGESLHAQNMLDLMTWESKSYKSQEEYVLQKNPQPGQSLWESIRTADSYADLHYYSILARLFRSRSDTELSSNSTLITEDDYFVKFRLRPRDPKLGPSHGSVTASAPLPPQRGYLPASPADERSAHYLREEFKQKLQTEEGATYILQLQKHKIPQSTEDVNSVLDPTASWDEEECPFLDIAELTLNMIVENDVAENMMFNSRNGAPSVAVVPAKSATDSASIDHCRSVVYDIAQTIRKGFPLPGAWRDLVRVDNLDLHPRTSANTRPAGGCPVMSPALKEQDQAQESNSTSSTSGWEVAVIQLVQPLLQSATPIVLLVLSAYPVILATAYIASKAGLQLWDNIFPLMLPVAYVTTGVLFTLLSVSCRWVLLGPNKEKATSELWSWHTVGFTIWEAINEVLRKTFLELVRGSPLYNTFLKLLGASIGDGVYLDSLNVLNPDQLSIGAGSAVGRNALFFGHLYERKKIFYKTNFVGEFCTIGTQALMLPGSQMKDGSELGALELGMKDEVIASSY